MPFSFNFDPGAFGGGFPPGGGPQGGFTPPPPKPRKPRKAIGNAFTRTL